MERAIPRPIPVPDGEWIDRLRKGNIIWLSKQQCYAVVTFPYLPPDPGCFSGSIGIAKIWGEMFVSTMWGFGHTEDWYITPDGKGFDGKQLIEPCSDHLPDEPPPLDHPVTRQLMRRIEHLTHRVEQLESGRRMTDTGFYFRDPPEF